MNSLLKLVIFDLDGLLVDTEKLSMINFNKICNKLGLVYNAEYHKKVMGKKCSQEELDDIIVGVTDENRDDVAIEILAYINNKREEIKNNGAPVKKGAIELLEFLKQNNILCVVASSSEKDYVYKVLRSSSLFDYFVDIITGEDVINGKPNPEVFLLCCDRYHIKPNEALVIEDSDNGGIAACNAGIPYIIVPDVANNSKEVLDNAYAVVNNLEEIIKLFS